MPAPLPPGARGTLVQWVHAQYGSLEGVRLEEEIARHTDVGAQVVAAWLKSAGLWELARRGAALEGETPAREIRVLARELGLTQAQLSALKVEHLTTIGGAPVLCVPKVGPLYPRQVPLLGEARDAARTLVVWGGGRETCTPDTPLLRAEPGSQTPMSAHAIRRILRNS